MANKSTGLTEMQRKFVHFYVECDGNGAKAARQAGYSDKNAAQSALQLLDNPKVKGAIDEAFNRRHEDMKKRIQMTDEEVITELEKYAKPEREDRTLPNGQVITVRESIDALKTLARIKGLDKGDSDGNTGITALINQMSVLSTEELKQLAKG